MEKFDFEEETFWLSQKKMAELFNVTVKTISERLWPQSRADPEFVLIAAQCLKTAMANPVRSLRAE